MKRSIGVTSLVLLLSGLLLSPALATTAGSKCAVLNKKVRSGSITLVCKKNTKGFKVWTKQTVTSKPSGSVPPTPTPTPTNKSPEIWQTAEQILDRAWNMRTKSSATFTYEFEPGWEVTEGLKISFGYMEEAADFFAALNIPITTKMLIVAGHFDFVSKRISELGCYQQLIDTPSDNCAPGVIFFNADARMFPDYQSVLIHEAFHQAQTDATTPVGRTRYHYPLWLRQGGAEVMRNYVYGKLAGVGYREMRRRAKDSKDDNCENFTLNSNIAQGRLTTATATCDYTGGFFTVERLIAITRTADSLVSFVRRNDISLDLYNRELGSGVLPALTESSYTEAIEKLYGLSAATFAKDMEAYAKGQIFG